MRTAPQCTVFVLYIERTRHNFSLSTRCGRLTTPSAPSDASVDSSGNADSGSPATASKARFCLGVLSQAVQSLETCLQDLGANIMSLQAASNSAGGACSLRSSQGSPFGASFPGSGVRSRLKS